MLKLFNIVSLKKRCLIMSVEANGCQREFVERAIMDLI